MTTNIIDTSLHVASFPATYTGPGNLIGNCRQSGGDETDVHGYFTSAGNVTELLVGFHPLEIDIVNETDGIEWTWDYGMASTHSIKVTLGAGGVFAGAIDTNSQILVTDGGAGNWLVTLGTTLVGTNKNIIFSIEG